MAIEFMLIAAPRSGTTWAANWLTTDTTLCLHDPLWTHHYTDLDSIKSNKMLGISCTGLHLFRDFLNSHKARKVILHRDADEINSSLCAIGLPEITKEQTDLLWQINGVHVPWTDLFNEPRKIYEYLTNKEFDQERFDLLKEINVQPNFSALKVDKEATRKLLAEIAGMANDVMMGR